MLATPVDWREQEAQDSLLAALNEALHALARLFANKSLEFWHEKVLTGLLQTALFSYRTLLTAWKEEGLSMQAWCARNLLEADIWMEFATKSQENARRFYMDWVNDMGELLDKAGPAPSDLKQSVSSSPYSDLDFDGVKPDAAREWINTLRASPDVIDSDYLKVATIAKQLGRGAQFATLNKLLSKYVHPTALSVLSMPSERARTNMSVSFLDEGSKACIRCVASLNTYLRDQGFPSIF